MNWRSECWARMRLTLVLLVIIPRGRRTLELAILESNRILPIERLLVFLTEKAISSAIL
jgi:hypothetical protein